MGAVGVMGFDWQKRHLYYCSALGRQLELASWLECLGHRRQMK